MWLTVMVYYARNMPAVPEARMLKKQPCAVNGIIMEAVPAGVWSV